MNRIIIAALATVLSITAAQAGTATVRHGDLNLATAMGIETLKTRVQAAAETACGPVQVDFGVSARTLYEAQAEQKACIRRTSAHALTRIQSARAGATVTRIARQ
jgi:UrcA family protein